VRVRSHRRVVHRVLVHVVDDQSRRELRFDVFAGTTFSVSTGSDFEVTIFTGRNRVISLGMSERETGERSGRGLDLQGTVDFVLFGTIWNEWKQSGQFLSSRYFG